MISQNRSEETLDLFRFCARICRIYRKSGLGRWPVWTLLIGIFFFWIRPVFAQYHPPDLAWKTLQTPHFLIYFPQGADTLARTVGQLAEEVYRPVCESLRYFPEKTFIVLHTRSDRSNGIVVPFPWRMELYPVEPPENWIGSRESWLKVLLTHEFTHVVHFRKHAGLTSLTRIFLGDFNSFWQGMLPRWFVEGFPTLNETRLTCGGRGRNPFHWMQMAASVEKAPWNVEQINYPSRKRLPTGMFYVAGYFLSEAVTKNYGSQAWGEILDRYTRFPMPGFRYAFRKVTGRSLKSEYRQVLKAFQRGNRDTLHTSGRWLLPVPYAENQYSPKWLSESELVFYCENFEDVPGLVRVDLAGHHRRLVDRVLAHREAGFDVLNGNLIWSEISVNPRYPAEERSQLVLWDSATGKKSVLARRRLINPSVCRNSGQIFATEVVPGKSRIVAIEPESGQVSVVAESDTVQFLNPAPSPNGRWVAVAIRDRHGWQDIALISVQDGGLQRLYAPDEFHDNHPSWSHDGKWLLFESDRSGKFQIWAISLEEKKWIQVTHSTYGAFYPSVSPDGKWIALSEYTPNGFRVTVVPFSEISRKPSAVHLPADVSEPILDEGKSGKSGRPQRPVSFRIAPAQTVSQVLLPQAWLPAVYQDENGLSVGLFGMAQDVLRRHSWTGFLGVAPQSRQGTYWLNYQYSRFWPVVELFIAQNPVRVTHEDYRAWWRKKIAEIAFRFPLLLETNVYFTRFDARIAFRTEQQNRVQGELLPRYPIYSAVRMQVQFWRYQASVKDLVPRKGAFWVGIMDLASRRLGGDVEARRLGGAFGFYLPLPLPHHQLEFRAAYLFRKGPYAYGDIGTVPPGASDMYQPYRMGFRVGYVFPVAFPEWKVPVLPVFWSAFGVRFFLHQGKGGQRASLWSSGLIPWQRSLGIEGIFSAYIFQQVPIRLYVQYYYSSERRQWQPGFRFQLLM